MAQEALEKSELRYRSIIENLIEGYFEIDLEGYIVLLIQPLSKYWER
jgi:PAS domain-containing protein